MSKETKKSGTASAKNPAAVALGKRRAKQFAPDHWKKMADARWSKAKTLKARRAAMRPALEASLKARTAKRKPVSSKG